MDAGPHLGIGGCVLTDRPTLEMFSLVPFNFHDKNNGAYDALARHLSALKMGVKSLAAAYSTLPNIGPRESLPPQHRKQRSMFPYQTVFTSLEQVEVKFSYIKKVEGSSLIFIGQTEHKDQIWIKFVQQYGKEVHD